MTPLDRAYEAMAADEDQRLQFYERLADGELFLLLESEAEGADLKPRVFPLEDGPVVLVFDLEERLADFAGGIAPYAALPAGTHALRSRDDDYYKMLAIFEAGA